MQAGALVQITGLSARPELNGRDATALKFDEEKQRWVVRTADGEELLVKSEKLRLADDGNGDEENAQEFLAACDETGVELSFGNWWHRKADAVGTSYDLCDAAYQQLSEDRRAAYVPINSVSVLHEHMGRPPPTESMPDLSGDAFQQALGQIIAPDADGLASSSAATERATAAIESLLDAGAREIKVADVLTECARLQEPPVDAPVYGTDEETARRGEAEVVALRALIHAAKQKPGMHFSRGGDDPADCVLSRLEMSGPSE